MASPVTCGACAADIPEAAYDYANGTALCPACGATIALADGAPIARRGPYVPSGVTVGTIAAASTGDVASYRTSPTAPAHEGMWLLIKPDVGGARALVGWLLAAGLLFGSCLYSGPMLDDETRVLRAVVTAVWIFAVYAAAALATRRVRIELTETTLRRSVGLLPWPGSFRQPRDRIAAFELESSTRKQSSRAARPRETYEVFAVKARLVDGQRIELLAASSNHEQAHYVMSSLEGRLQHWHLAKHGR